MITALTTKGARASAARRNESVLTAENVGKVFVEGKVRVEVLRDCSLDLAAGEIVVLEGPSGSGKTTLLSIMGCILSPTSGHVRIAGERVDHRRSSVLRRVRREHIGFVFQQFNLFPSLSALENLEYALNVRGMTGKKARSEAERVLVSVGLGDRLDFLPRDLSGGQKQRVAIARALAGEPKVILADEPTANLDTQSGKAILELFAALARRERRGLLIVTHDPNVRAIADRVIAIRDGRLNDRYETEWPADASRGIPS